jgi:methylated-DNA-protein-cysteine methyltransferase-like protein
MTRNLLYDKIYRIVLMVPFGRVATYGQIARKAGLGHQARLVGYALHNLPDDSIVPWHRVINARGMISLRGSANLQKLLLENESIVFNAKGRIDLNKYLWGE